VTGGILIYAEDPGAANWIVPLIPALESREIAFVLVCESDLNPYFEARGINATSLEADQTAPTLISAHRPRLLLAGTAENFDSRGLDLIDAAATTGIPSVSFVDQGANAEHRFRGRTSNPLAHAPDWLLVPDAAARQAFVSLGLAEQQIIVTGNPHLDRVRNRARLFEQQGREALRHQVAPDAPQDAPLVVFIAEIGYVVNPEGEDWEKNLNFEGRDGTAPRCARILEEVLDALPTTDPGPWFILRLHPKNTAGEFEAYRNDINQLSAGGDPLGLLWAADLVVGMSSAPLEEAHAMGRPVLSVLPHKVERDWLPSLASRDITIIESREGLRTVLPTMLSKAKTNCPAQTENAGAIPLILDQLERAAQNMTAV
jgi:hypothetical protein